MGNNFGQIMQSLPEMKYHPEKGLNVTLSPQMIMSLLQGQQQQPGNQPPQMPPRM